MLRFSLTTALILAGAALVIYARLKNWVDTNIPVVFFAALLFYATVVGDMIPAWLTYLGLATTTLLRFEFMNVPFTRFFKVVEMCVVAGVLYECLIWMLGR